MGYASLRATHQVEIRNLLVAAREYQRSSASDSSKRTVREAQKALNDQTYAAFSPDKLTRWRQPEDAPRWIRAATERLPRTQAIALLLDYIEEEIEDVGLAASQLSEAVAAVRKAVVERGNGTSVEPGSLSRRGAVESGGRPYMPAARRSEPSEEKSRVFEVDPDKIDRGTAAHMEIQDALAAELQSRGLAPLSPAPLDPDFDLAWRSEGTAHIVEVKSVTAENEEKQLRLGLGQLLSYLHRLAWEGIDQIEGVLAVEYEPSRADWLDICARHGVTLTWPEVFEGLFTAERDHPADD